ncbi:sensor histidine kinase [Domibacillus robiginosus]|uniref:sensor histidine kinase n=1 Tax=Domibacillus robiginosus TaxID=1071054 RepID=UPI00067B20CF|nr:sensor histidine kinase [Domibacillus robiginosus]
MNLFFREHIALIIVQLIQFGMIFLVYWLDGYRHIKPALYGCFLALFFLGVYLVYRYVTHRAYYSRLSRPVESMDNSLQKLEEGAIPQALHTLLVSQYRHYESRVREMDRQQNDHLTFMNQWVHQMKTPLSVIELTAQQMDEPESSSIREETERMREGLDTVLYMARLRTFEQDFYIKSIRVSEVIEDVIRENKRLFIRNGVYPKTDLDRAIVAESDEKWLFFILQQLVQNAVKYSTGKGNEVRISLTSRSQKAMIEVTDFGVGIPKTDLKRVFDPFFTGENGRHFRESTGMGLYIASEAAARLDHRLEIQSEPGKGTTVRIVFDSWRNLTSL